MSTTPTFGTATYVTGKTYYGTEQDDTYKGTIANDLLMGYGGHDTLYGSSGDDDLYGGNGNDTLDGGYGDDFLMGGAGADILIGGPGTDKADYGDSADSVYVTIGGLGFGGTANGDQIRDDIENVSGSDASDIIAGNYADNTLEGRGGNDILEGGAGRDYLYGGDGNDLLVGGAGPDYLIGQAGFDTASYADSAFGVRVALGGTTVGRYYTPNAGGTAEGDTIHESVEALSGSAYDDTLEGNDLANTLMGHDGADHLIGYGGKDILIGGKGADYLSGGTGIDTVDYAGSAAGVQIRLNGGWQYGGDAQGDFIDGTVEDVIGSAYRDIVDGNAANNRLEMGDGKDVATGGAGDDTLVGGAGDDYLTGDGDQDRLFGNDGADVLMGGTGNDNLYGGSGADVMQGGLGADDFHWVYADTDAFDEILDFSSAQGDILNFAPLDANVNLTGNQSFTFIGDNPFSGAAGELRAHTIGYSTWVTMDTNGDAIADFGVELLGVSTISAADMNL